MELQLYRKYYKDGYTIGKLYVDDIYFCDTLEPPATQFLKIDGVGEIKLQKQLGKMAIPRGRYKIDMATQSPRFAVSKTYARVDGVLPRLCEVTGFNGVLIHIGNWAKDTDGCILVGKNTAVGAVMNSAYWFWKLYDVLYAERLRGKESHISIF